MNSLRSLAISSAVVLVAACARVEEQTGPTTLRMAMMPELAGIPHCNACEKGTRKAAADAGLSGTVVVSGLTLPSSMRPHVTGGTVKRFVLWSPVDLGSMTVHAAVGLLEGGIWGERLVAGRLGECRVRGTEVLLGKPVDFDASTIDDCAF